MKNIIVYTTPEKLWHKQDKLENDPDKSSNGIYYWRLHQIPKDWKDLTDAIYMHDYPRIYFATDGYIRGYFIVDDILSDDCGWDIEFDSKTWKEISPIPIKHFQGFKYANNVEGLK